MRTVYLIRHAKSDWGISVDDFDRPLNERGKRDAPMMAGRLTDRAITIDAFVSSPAKRAFKTAKIFAEAFGVKKDTIMLKPELYLPPPATFFDVISNLDNSHRSVAIFSHNNGITEFANLLGLARIDNMPTCSIFAFETDAKKWEQFKDAPRKFLFFDYPKRVIS